MDDKRNLIMAVLLTGLILFGWPYVAERLFPGSMKPATLRPCCCNPLASSRPNRPAP